MDNKNKHTGMPMVLFNVDEQNRLVEYAVCNDSHECGRYLKQQAELALYGTYIPNERIYCMTDADFTDERLPGLLTECISQNDISDMPSLGLRCITFIHENFKDGLPDDMLSVTSCIEKVIDDFRSYTHLQEYEQYNEKKANAISGRTVSAIETDKGVLLFDDSGRGLRCLDNCLQYIADNYFSPEIQCRKMLNIYHFSTTNAETVRKSRECAGMFTPDSECRFIPTRARSLPNLLTGEFKPAKSFSLDTDPKSYHSLTQQLGLHEKDENREIAALMEIRNNGMPADWNPADLKMHGNGFRHIYNRIKGYDTTGNTELSEALQQAARDKAAQILSSVYDVRQRGRTISTNEGNIKEKPDNPDKRKNCNHGLKI